MEAAAPGEDHFFKRKTDRPRHTSACNTLLRTKGDKGGGGTQHIFLYEASSIPVLRGVTPREEGSSVEGKSFQISLVKEVKEQVLH